MGLNTFIKLMRGLFSLFKSKLNWLWIILAITGVIVLTYLQRIINENAILNSQNQQLNQQLQNQTQQLEALQHQIEQQQQISESYAKAQQQQQQKYQQQQEQLHALLNKTPHHICLPNDSVRLLNNAIRATQQ
ncbi:hypothetical protein [Histophilus somni]|uniref:hypothetical protein n=1 Tax=Histophilus somni TaxID=731 RepID=UPI00201F086D|nr:hypothetical protein [Histophilus somni]